MRKTYQIRRRTSHTQRRRCTQNHRRKKVTFSLRKKKSVENSKQRKLLNEGNSEIEQVIGKRQRKKTKRLIEEDDLDEEDVEKQCR